jgi:murein L,D-transpeptidase YcbB/YkuD
VAQFYELRELVPAWDPENAAALLRVIDRTPEHGLDPRTYHRAVLTDISEISFSEDVLLTDAFITLADHLLRGSVHPESLISNWCIPPKRFDLPVVLEAALDGQSIERVLPLFAPPHQEYRRLQRALTDYRDAPDWPLVDSGPVLCRGVSGPRVTQLRARLGATPGDAFDEELDILVRDFQRQHGIAPDGVVGNDTIVDLNVPRQERIRQVVENLERWRWMPHALPDRYLLVNIAAFQLEGFDAGQRAISMRTAVGKYYTKTPFLRSEVTKIVLNPYWNVPPSIATREMRPKQAADPTYFAREHIEELAGGQLRQSPGAWNALGRVKFDMPNPYAVYLHDTPSRSVFGSDARAVSHGCVRVERPVDLAVWLLRGTQDASAIRKQIANGRNQHLKIDEPVRVYVLYWTAFVDDRGEVQFRRDVYGRDAELLAALENAPLKITSPPKK